MIFYAKDKIAGIREKVWNGQGEVHGLNCFTADGRPGKTCFQMLAENTLPVGASIGVHTHTDNEEVYIITKGRGIYTDNDGQEYPVLPGDTTLTRRGEKHGLAQSGDEPMTFLAIIAG
ncbi:cupin domain-containing protein [Deltaproteobacteria bacterium OttesenSCG-928-M10]|nr:cupin domain-containing protein [Deltaproteobacteria bacterium OttesenSCG-928-M10]